MELGYYRLVKPFIDDEGKQDERWEVGELWYLSQVQGDTVSIIQGGSSWTMDIDEFADHFEYAPEGLQERQQQMLDLMTGMHSIGARQDNLIAASQTPKLLGDDTKPRPEPKAVAPSDSTAIARMAGRDPAVAAHNLKKVKTGLAYTKRGIAKRQGELQAMIREQELILRSKTEMLAKQIEMAEEAIYIINAYLGTDEEIVQIRKGKPAPANAKISIRQLVLFMDEESAAAADWAEKGGMDFKNVKEFDQWVLADPKHLRQVLPEEKGVVAIKPRRNDKFYDDNPFVNSELNRQNKCLYILIRNGDQLFRIYTRLWLEDVLLPRKDEFQEFFYERRYDHKQGEYVTEPLVTGSRQYMEAMEKAQKKHRRFYTVLILLQGLLDRTKVFHPLPTDQQINVCNLAEASKFVTLIYDAENLLGDNRPDFDDWLADVNGRLEVGCRIIGTFRSHYYYDRSESRKHPASAAHPDDMVLHALEKKVGDEEYQFLYSRKGETVYSGWGDYRGHEAVRRASFRVYTSDKFILNFDAATVPDMEYYINSRLNRHNYEYMIPLMKVAIKLKKQEKRQEAPFRQLLIGEIAKAHDVSHAEAERQIDTLIDWWKFKVKMHRALTSEDAKALRMIVKEFGRRREIAADSEERSDMHEQVCTELRRDQANTLAVFYRNDNEYTVYRWYNQTNLFVLEQLWKLKSDGRLDLADQKPWTTVDKRHQSWKMLWAHDRWAGWQIGARPQDHLTDPEIEAAKEYILADLKSDTEWHSGWDRAHKAKRQKRWLAPLAMMFDEKERIWLYYIRWHAHISKNICTEGAKEIEYGRCQVVWERKDGQITFRHSDSSGVCFHIDNPPWQKGYNGALMEGKNPVRILVLYEDNITAAREETRQVREVKKQQRRLEAPLHHVCRQAQKALLDIWYEEQHKKFLDQYVDEDDELWGDFKEDLKPPSSEYWPSWIDSAAGYLLERGVDIDGWTIERLVKESKKHGFEMTDRAQEQYEVVKGLVIEYKLEEDDGEEEEEED
jgi:hypothetical protein